MDIDRPVLAAVLLSLLLAVAISPAADPPPSSATLVVALGGVELPDAVELPGSLAARIESAVADALHERGLETVRSEEFETVWQERLRQAGGYFDIVSGRPDLAKRRALRAAALGELQALHGARVLLQTRLVVVSADYSRGKAEWDGARETAAPTGSGELPALSLEMRVEDLAGREPDVSRAGIQLLAKYSMWNSKYGLVPPEKLLADEGRLREAVGRALTPLLAALLAAPATAEPVESVVGETAAEVAAVEIVPPPEGAGVAALRALLLPPGEIVVPPDVQSRYLGLLGERLERAGWWVLPPDAFEQTLRGIALELGGIYDPINGKGDPDKLSSALADTRRRLAERYGASIFVTSGILLRPVRFAGEKATWDGVSEKVTEIATWKKVLTSTRGTTMALSFGVLVEDVEGLPLHSGFGGIQLAERVERDRFVHVSPDALFADPALDEHAVELALGGFELTP